MKIEQPVKEMERMSGEAGLGREHYYLDFSAHLDENIDKVNVVLTLSLSPFTSFKLRQKLFLLECAHFRS